MRRLSNVELYLYFPSISDIVKFISTLIEKGYAYGTDGDVYYIVPGTGSYQDIDDPVGTLNCYRGGQKDHSLDFAL